MVFYPESAVERAMKIQEVILRAMAKKITWRQAAEILGISDRHLPRRRERYEEFGFRRLFDRRRGRPLAGFVAQPTRQNSSTEIPGQQKQRQTIISPW